MMRSVRDVVRESGLWNDGRERSHGFILSPSVYTIDADKEVQLAELGKSLEKSLFGLSYMASIALDPKKGKGRCWQKLCAIFMRGVPIPMKEIQLLNPGLTPAICKVDLIESANGRYYIAEIDGQNKHGLGYSTLTANIRDAVMPNAQCYPGVAAQIARAIKAYGINNAMLIYGDQERFYEPEFAILKAKLASFGVDLTVINEISFRRDDMAEMVFSETSPPLLLDFSEMNRNIPLRSYLSEMYSTDKIRFLIPPKPFLGSKAMLAILRNDEGDEEIEMILRQYIDENTLVSIRQFIPRTYLVRKKHPPVDWKILGQDSGYILKRVVSYGMKGVHFPDDRDYHDVLRMAIESSNVYVMQEIVESAAKRFGYYDDEGKVQETDWHMRVTAHYSRGEMADIVVTARRDRRVHGAKDCLQIGCCLTPNGGT